MRKWTVIKINCDTCGSYVWARQRPPQYNKIAAVLCRECRKPMGDMEWKELATVLAETELEAIYKAKESQK